MSVITIPTPASSGILTNRKPQPAIGTGIEGRDVSLNAGLAALHASRVATWKPEDLQVNINQRQALVESFDRRAGVQPGDVLENFSLPEVDGGQVTLDSLVAHGPAVLVFFRFAGCPACNIALPYYQNALAPALEAAGLPLAAISPQPVERLVAIKRKHALSFPVLSDTGSAFARALGLLYSRIGFDSTARALYMRAVDGLKGRTPEQRVVPAQAQAPRVFCS